MSRIVLAAERLLTDSFAPVVQDALVCVEGDVIAYAGPRKSAPDWARLGNIDELGDVTLMPGLFDCHVHLCMDPMSTDVSTEMASDHNQLRRLMVANSRRLLDAGVTTARDLGSPSTLGTEVRDLLSGGVESSPRLLVANAPITVTGGHASSMGGVADDANALREQVRNHAAQGVDVIKVMATGGFMTPGTHPSQARYSVEQLAALVAEAHAHGLPVTTHALGVEGIERAVLAGVDSIEHCGWLTVSGSNVDLRIAREIIERGIAVSPTMNTACTAGSYMCPWDDRGAVIANLRQLVELGAVIVAGTDAGIPFVHFEGYADGLETLAEAGMTPRQIVASATEVAARVCGLQEVTGRLSAGLSADVIAVEGDPTADVGSLRHPAFVMAAGRVHKVRVVDRASSDAAARERVLHALESGAGSREPSATS